MRFVVLVVGIVLGLFMLDEAQGVGTLAAFAGSDDAAVTALLGYAATILTFVGAGLVVPAPRAAGWILAVAAVGGLILGAGTALWTDMYVWGTVDAILALMAFAAWRGRRRRKIRQEADRHPAVT